MHEIRDKAQIDAFLRTQAAANIYQLGDLEEPLWQDTHWLASSDGEGRLTALLLLYEAPDPYPRALLAIDAIRADATHALLAEAASTLPDKMLLQLTPGFEHALSDTFKLRYLRTEHKMWLTDPSKLIADAGGRVVPLGPRDLDEVEALMEVVYPPSGEDAHFFHAGLLATGQYFGVREEGRLAGMAGVHVYAPPRGVGAIANVVTLPDFRNRGIGTCTTSAVARSLLRSGIDIVGLNVLTDNASAIHLYQRIGFEIVTQFTAWEATRRP
jgi:ribosomal protein S18 acetylase RimI-like enzyme